MIPILIAQKLFYNKLNNMCGRKNTYTRTLKCNRWVEFSLCHDRHSRTGVNLEFISLPLSCCTGVSSYKVDLESKMVVVIGDIIPFEVLESVSRVKNAELWNSPSSWSMHNVLVPFLPSSQRPEKYKGTQLFFSNI